MTNVLPFSGGKRCYVCHDQISPARVRENPDVVTCDAGCTIQHDYNKAQLFGSPAAQASPQQAAPREG